MRERARPARGHVQRGDRRDDGAAAHAHGLRDRRLDEEHSAEEFPATQSIYGLYGKADQVETVQIDAPHNYNQQSREAMYRFFGKHLLGETRCVAVWRNVPSASRNWPTCWLCTVANCLRTR